MKINFSITTLLFLQIVIVTLSLSKGYAQKTATQNQKSKISNLKSSSFSLEQDDYSLLTQSLRWRCIGPFRGGRSLAVCGVRGNNQIYYFGAVGGGVWKTTNGGTDWSCISDSTFHSSSVGAIT